MFTQREVSEIQQVQQFFNPQMEQQFISGRITQLRDAEDIAGAHQFVDYLDGQMEKGYCHLH
jgi:ABC-type molybdate transport system substrate-binding protein